MPDAVPPVQIPQMPDKDAAMYMAIGQLTAAVNANAVAAVKNAEATERNTAAVQKMEVRLVKGDARMDRQDARHNELPCVKGLPLPPGCPGTTQNVVLPAQASTQAGDSSDTADAIKWRWLVKTSRFARDYWREIVICATCLYCWFMGGRPPSH